MGYLASVRGVGGPRRDSVPKGWRAETHGTPEQGVSSPMEAPPWGRSTLAARGVGRHPFQGPENRILEARPHRS